MAKVCSWCGKQIAFLDLSYDWVEIGEETHWICGECYNQIKAATNGNITFEKIATIKTDAALFNYYTGQKKSPEEMLQQESKRKEEQRIKKESQKTNPLYEDIHQIAGDLRFIKNYLIFCIIVGVFLGLLLVLSMLSH